MSAAEANSNEPRRNFIRNIIDEDIKNNKNDGKVITRFPPEPNGYLHLGHTKSICLNFAIAKDYNNGFCYLRFDDSNPVTEDTEYSDAIKRDIKWLGFDWGDHLAHASDYYDQFYESAKKLIQDGKAYVCGLSADDVKVYRGSLTEAGKESPDRNRSAEENLDLFERMKNGEFEEGQYTLRAKIDMSSGNVNMRDPMIYRIRKVAHHRTGDKWCIYPMYDFAHPLSDAIEGITHSLCTLEFQDHRPLYDWVVENCGMEKHPQQIEFSRLNLNYTITSKRKLRKLVEAEKVDGWDDPRLATICGARRRGYPAAAIRNFCADLGYSKQDSIIDMSVLENCVRDDLNASAPRRMAVLNPIKVVITNFPEGEVQTLTVSNHPQHPEMGMREIPFSNTLYIDQDDFMLEPVPKYFRLKPDGDVRLMNAYVIHCDEVIKNDDGKVVELRCTYDKDTFAGKKPADGRKIKGVIHWLSAAESKDAEVRLYDRLFNVENPAAEEDFLSVLNPDSLRVIENAKIETSLLDALPEDTFQFNRTGYFVADMHDHSFERPVFNRVVGLRDNWKK